MHPSREPPHRLVRFLSTLAEAPGYPENGGVHWSWPEDPDENPPNITGREGDAQDNPGAESPAEPVEAPGEVEASAAEEPHPNPRSRHKRRSGASAEAFQDEGAGDAEGPRGAEPA